MIAPLPATKHIAWAEVGIFLDTSCCECGTQLRIDADDFIWCLSCDGERVEATA